MVELKNISFRYGSEERQDYGENSLSGIDLIIHDGEFVLLTGPSGCGKTTILRLINGLIPHFYSGSVDGEVLIEGKAVSSQELYDTALKVGTVFQNPRSQFYNVDTTGELAFGCENRGLPEEQIYKRIDDTVTRFSIEKLMDRSIFHLSDGEKQKIACASVDVSGPDIILLDEPSANLDYEATLALRELILEWRRQGKTIIAAEHRIAYLWDLIDRAVIMRNGRIICELRGDETNTLTQNVLAEMGLRSTIQESPSSISLPLFLEGDEPLTLKGFRLTYSGAKEPVVNISDLTLAAGEIMAITGANGAGKTSLLSCICGLEKRCKGALVFKEKTYSRKNRQKLCFMVMQDTGNQLFTESVLEEVLISLPKNTENEKDRAEEILRALDLEPFLERHPQSLSGGQKQRLAIACALASGRRVLLLDEPTSGLDYAHMMETANLLKQLQCMGTTILVVTHDSELIHACCTRQYDLEYLNCQH
ncbi:MAG: ABC transporter ATP-binding protein [Lachnospiraceae bacterium]|nr:ABC transporter ATP-binding protein [Lachnospiraceae bacterium]